MCLIIAQKHWKAQKLN